MKIALILAVVAAVTNALLIWYAKRKFHKVEAEESSDNKKYSDIYSKGYLNTPEVKQLKQQAAADLCITVEELERMSSKELTQLAKDKELINTG